MRDSHQEFVDYYRVLGVGPEASHREIREAYRREAMRWHPDRNASADAAGRMRLVNEAWGVLGDTEGRSSFDRDRQLQKSTQGSSKGRDCVNGSGMPKTNDRKRPKRKVRPEKMSDGKSFGIWVWHSLLFFGIMIGLLVVDVWIASFFARLRWEIAPAWWVEPLTTAAMILVLLSYGLFVFAVCGCSRNEGENALHRLMKSGDVSAWGVESLLRSDTLPSDRDSTGQTPLTVAAKHGADAEILEKLATRETILRSPSSLYWLIANGSNSQSELSKVNTLIAAGIIDARESNPWSWFVQTARKFRVADTDKYERHDRYRGLELHALLSRRNVQPDVVATLVHAGASLTAKDRYGRTPLEIALEMRHPRAIIELLAP